MPSKEYDMAVALLRFKSAYQNLVKSSKALPDYDISDYYPFYLIDFEELDNAVAQWCTVHAANMMSKLSDVVDNPACLDCKYFRAGLLPSGFCKGFEAMSCNEHPTIVFDKSKVIPFLVSQGLDQKELEVTDPNELLFLYIMKVDNYRK